MAKGTSKFLLIAGLALLLVVAGNSGALGSPAASGGPSPGSASGSKDPNDLHPNLVPLFQQTFAGANASLPNGVTIVIDSTFRTFDEQAADYAQGRTAPGSIITDASPGHSYHNYGLAFDWHLNVNGTDYWPSGYSASLNNTNWMTVVSVFKSAGFAWGGDWNSFKDIDHLQMSYGYSTSDLLNLYNNGDFVTSQYNGNNYVNLADA